MSELTPDDVSVVVPVGGAAPAWSRCSASLARLDPPPGEIVVVVDGGDPALAATAGAIGARVERLDRRGGPARARNLGAELAGGEIVFFLDSDVEAPPDLIARLVEILRTHPAAAAVIGSYDDAPADPGFLSQYRNLLHHYVHQQGRERASTFWSGCGAVRRDAFAAVGGFDARYADPSIEDIELGARLLAAGYPIRLAKQLQVKHLKRWRLWDMVATDLWRRAVPWTRLMLGRRRLIDDLNVKTRERWSVATACLAPAALVVAPLVAAPWRPLPLAVAAAAALAWLGLSAGFVRFLWRRRGARFAVAAVPVYWLYFVVCGLGFALGLASLAVR